MTSTRPEGSTRNGERVLLEGPLDWPPQSMTDSRGRVYRATQAQSEAVVWLLRRHDNRLVHPSGRLTARIFEALSTLGGIYRPESPNAARQRLAYLEAAELVEVDRRGRRTFAATLRYHGPLPFPDPFEATVPVPHDEKSPPAASYCEDDVAAGTPTCRAAERPGALVAAGTAALVELGVDAGAAHTYACAVAQAAATGLAPGESEDPFDYAQLAASLLDEVVRRAGAPEEPTPSWVAAERDHLRSQLTKVTARIRRLEADLEGRAAEVQALKRRLVVEQTAQARTEANLAAALERVELLAARFDPSDRTRQELARLMREIPGFARPEPPADRAPASR